jgi:hypothetical protein
MRLQRIALALSFAVSAIACGGMSEGVSGTSDRDGDGVSNSADMCPDAPEDHDAFEDSDGCPDVDNDRDGISDVDDRCPNVSEDADGDADDDGCPEAGKTPEPEPEPASRTPTAAPP